MICRYSLTSDAHARSMRAATNLRNTPRAMADRWDATPGAEQMELI
jgi:hypothetical protein